MTDDTSNKKKASSSPEEQAKAYMTRDQEYALLREAVNRDIESSGPLRIPKELQHPDYEYSLPVYDPSRQFKFKKMLDLGYEFVRPEEMPGLQEALNVGHKHFGAEFESDRIVAGTAGGQKHYLMKISKERYAMIQTIKREKREERNQITLSSIPHQENFYGEIRVGRETPFK